jgi:hypothetical protein
MSGLQAIIKFLWNSNMSNKAKLTLGLLLWVVYFLLTGDKQEPQTHIPRQTSIEISDCTKFKAGGEVQIGNFKANGQIEQGCAAPKTFESLQLKSTDSRKQLQQRPKKMKTPKITKRRPNNRFPEKHKGS